MDEKELTDRLASRRRLSRGLLASCLCLAAVTAAPAQQKPDIANDVEKKNLPRDVDTKIPKDDRPARRAAPPPPRRATASPLAVTFMTGLNGVDVFLNSGAGNMQKLGKTGADGNLVAKLPRGAHTVTASRIGGRIVRRQIDVQPGKTAFTFDLTGYGVAEGGVAPAPSAEEVFTRFLDPKQTDGVTFGQWQFAQAQTAAANAQNPLDPHTAAQAHFAQGQVAYLRGDYASALVAFNKAALTLPNSALAFYGLGNAYLATNQLGEASRAYQQAIRLRENMALAHKGMGDVLMKQGKSKEAFTYYGRAGSLGYNSPALELARAQNLLKQRQWQPALNLFLEVAKKKPSPDAFVGIGDSYVGLKQPMSASAAYRQATQSDPRSALAHYKYGEVNYQLREYAAALDAFERALALDLAGTSFNRKRAREMADDASRKLGRKK